MNPLASALLWLFVTSMALARRIEAWLRANPVQWLWGHRRFKNAVWPRDQKSH